MDSNHNFSWHFPLKANLLKHVKSCALEFKIAMPTYDKNNNKNYRESNTSMKRQASSQSTPKPVIITAMWLVYLLRNWTLKDDLASNKNLKDNLPNIGTLKDDLSSNRNLKDDLPSKETLKYD